MPLAHLDKIRPKVLDKVQDGYRWPVNGGELQANWDGSQGTAGWITSGATSISSVVYLGEDSVLISLDSDGNFKFGTLSIAELEIGKTYRVVVRAARGSQGSLQTVGDFSYGANSLENVDSTFFKNYEFDVVSTATSGATKCYAAVSGGIGGDSIYVSSISIREI